MTSTEQGCLRHPLLRVVDIPSGKHDAQSLRTASLTPNSSIASTRTTSQTTIIEVPDLLQSLFFGGASLPFAASTIPEEKEEGVGEEDEQDTTIATDGVPRCVTTADTLELTVTIEAAPPPVEAISRSGTEKLKELLRTHPQMQVQQQQQNPLPPRSKKKKTSKRIKAAAKKVFLPFSSSSGTWKKNKRSSSSQSLTSQTSRPSPLLTTIDAQSIEGRTPISALSSFNFDDDDDEEESKHCLEEAVSTKQEASRRIPPTTTASSRSPAGVLVVHPNNTTNNNEPQDLLLVGIRQTAHQQEAQVQETSRDIQSLQTQLAKAIAKYQAQLSSLQATQQQLEGLVQNNNSNSSSTPLLDDAPKATTNGRIMLQRTDSGSFMRIADLDLDHNNNNTGDERRDSLSSLSQSAQSMLSPTEFLLMDHHLLSILPQLMEKGYELAIDEGDRYTATRDTAKLMMSNQQQHCSSSNTNWPITPWTSAFDQHVLVWSGRVSHSGFGHTWPVVKGRSIMNTSARGALECLWDSKIVAQYNPMCQGRDDVYVIQDNVHTTVHESRYGFAGCAKIVRSLNKHRLLPKAIEMKSLLYAKPLTFSDKNDTTSTTAAADKKNDDLESYILVSRSVWENDSATLDQAAAKAVIRTEMLLGCTILRALNATTCEMTQMSHVHSPGVPEMLARRAAPGQCHSLMKALQAMFPPSSLSS